MQPDVQANQCTHRAWKFRGYHPLDMRLMHPKTTLKLRIRTVVTEHLHLLMESQLLTLGLGFRVYVTYIGPSSL